MKQKINLLALLLFASSILFAQNKVPGTGNERLGQFKTEGIPIIGATVKYGNDVKNKLETKTNKEGSFSLKLEKGNYTISLNKDELVKSIKSLKEKYPNAKRFINTR